MGDPILDEYKDVFNGICTNPDVAPVVHPSRRLPIALQETVKNELDILVNQEVLAPVTEPTEWVSSMVVTPKKNNQIRICLDPKDLNQAIMHSHYPLPTIEEITADAKLFTVLDAKTGFWQVKLEKQSSYLTTFNTLFGWYRWKRMPFSSVPEVWQQRMNQLVEGLPDDFLVCGFGETPLEVKADHDDNLRRFLERARERNLKLNPQKVRLRKKSVPFMGHLLTEYGLEANPEKVEAIVKMLTPTNMKFLRVPGYGVIPFEVHTTTVREDRTPERVGTKGCRMVLAGSARSSS